MARVKKKTAQVKFVSDRIAVEKREKKEPIAPPYWRCWSCNTARWWIQDSGNIYVCAVCHPPLNNKYEIFDMSHLHPKVFSYPPALP